MTNRTGDAQSAHGDDEVERPVQGVDADGSPARELLGEDAPRLAGKRADERDAQLRDEADVDPPRDRADPPANT
ncbi:MAG: hypothetical protein M3419_08460 [Actinomycetota bacterium]|nr:hypothetical protein [Actinomycetota bacterium]